MKVVILRKSFLAMDVVAHHFLLVLRSTTHIFKKKSSTRFEALTDCSRELLSPSACFFFVVVAGTGPFINMVP